MECSQCFSKNITRDDSRAEVICEDCGFLSEQTDTQRETEFEEMENGRIAAIGQIISTGKHATKQNTINKASVRIHNLCAKLGLTKCLSSYAVSIFESALALGMTRGRNALVTVGACVYLAARIKQQSLMLLDISDKLGVNVYVLGKTYNELKEKTAQRVSDVDPCLFIDRFAMELELGDKTAAVATTALKLLQRMKKDWISTGRRPTGITAAALLIAARLHSFDRDCQDVAKIAGVSHYTTKKRLQEWAQTSTADLTLAQFGHIEFEDELDPPSFSNQKVKEQAAVQMTDEEFETVRTEMNNLKAQLEVEGVVKNREKFDETSKYQKILDSVENGDVDVEALIETLRDNEDDNEDTLLEIDGRKELMGECIGMREAFMSLKKKESIIKERHSEDQLPVFLPGLIESECEGRWPREGSEMEDLEEIDDEELERVYICSKKHSIEKIATWSKMNKTYYSDMKRSIEKRNQKHKVEEDSDKKNRIRRQKRSHAHMMDPDEVLRDIKAGLSQCQSPAVKVQRNNDSVEESVEVAEDVTEECEEEEEEDQSELYKNEQKEDASDTSEHIQYDFNEDE